MLTDEMWNDNMCAIFVKACEIMHDFQDDVDMGTEYLIIRYHSKDISADQLSFMIGKLVDYWLYC